MVLNPQLYAIWFHQVHRPSWQKEGAKNGARSLTRNLDSSSTFFFFFFLVYRLFNQEIVFICKTTKHGFSHATNSYTYIFFQALQEVFFILFLLSLFYFYDSTEITSGNIFKNQFVVPLQIRLCCININ